MKLAAIWEFVAGESRRTPPAVALAVVSALLLQRAGLIASPLVGGIFALIVGLGLAAGVFERR